MMEIKDIPVEDIRFGVACFSINNARIVQNDGAPYMQDGVPFVGFKNLEDARIWSGGIVENGIGCIIFEFGKGFVEELCPQEIRLSHQQPVEKEVRFQWLRKLFK